MRSKMLVKKYPEQFTEAAVAELRKLARKAIESGQEQAQRDREETRRRMHATHVQQWEGASHRAHTAVAAIPDLIRRETAKVAGKNPTTANLECSTIVFWLDALESTENPGSYCNHHKRIEPETIPDSSKLQYAARLIYAHCAECGLSPFLGRGKDPESRRYRVRLYIGIRWKLLPAQRSLTTVARS